MMALPKPWSGWFAASALAVAMLLSNVARADVVDSPPDDCPDGAVGSTCHGGPFCSPALCTTSADCKSGQSCLPTALCTKPFDCGFGDTTPEVLGSCANPCASGTCQTLTVCTTTGGTTSSTSATTSTTTSSAGGGGAGGASGGAGGAGGGGGNDLVVTGCACTMDGRRTASGVAGTLLLAVSLASLAGRRRKRPRRR